jgi:ubiquinone/menaquinone biosynthesis C-methylase UbiE
VAEIDRAARAFEHVAAEYEDGRPGYAPDVVAHAIAELETGPGSIVLDLGAGTGKLTRMLLDAELAVIAIDPSPAMLAQLRGTAPSAQAVVGAAEAVPLPAESVDAVTAGQAFHWFDATAALAAIHRVLRPGGGVALLWNRRDLADPVQRLLVELTDPPERTSPRGRLLDMPRVIAETGLFGPVSQFESRHVQPIDESGLLSRLRSSSFVAGLPPDRRAIGPVQEVAHTTIAYVARRV